MMQGAISTAVEHCLHTAGVSGSIPLSPTNMMEKKMNNRKKIVAGNWKMNGTRASVEQLLTEIKKGAENSANIEWIVFPPYPFLQQVADLLQGSKIAWGAQNVCDKPSGAYTGEVSAKMLTEFGCKYVLLGHSERRALFAEDDNMVAAKFIAVSEAGLIPIICVGENLAERKAGVAEKIVEKQVEAILKLDKKDFLNNAIIAYEPVWAIGTGVTATPQQAQQMHLYIREKIAQYDSEIAKKISILYGGSVKPDNARAIFGMADIDGGLIGGAALNSNDFLEVGKSCIQ
jgi:triosephosphate isomerase